MAVLNGINNRKPLFIWALLAVPFVFIVIGWGAFTRLADAGLGCPDWPPCYGYILWPDEAHEISKANAEYQSTPVETDKTWPEQVHRLFAAGLGLISLAVFFLSIRRSNDSRLNKQLLLIVGFLLSVLVARIVLMATVMEVSANVMHDRYDILAAIAAVLAVVLLAVLGLRHKSSSQPLKLPAFIVVFVILQGLFGMWTVTLKVWPQVVTLHLLGGFTLAALFWLLALRLNNRIWRLPEQSLQQLNRLKPLLIIAFVVVVGQIALGGWTTSNYAAVACPDLPTCQGQMWPTMDFRQGFNVSQAIGPNYLGGQMDNEARIAIHMAHRIGAIVTSVVLLILAAYLLLGVNSQQTNKQAYWLIGVLLLQVALGLANIVFHFPLSVAVAHNAGGALLLLVMVTLLHHSFTAEIQTTKDASNE